MKSEKREPIRHARVRLELSSEVPLPRGGRDGELIGAPFRFHPLMTWQLRWRDW
jgi:hypothetical protein